MRRPDKVHAGDDAVGLPPPASASKDSRTIGKRWVCAIRRSPSGRSTMPLSGQLAGEFAGLAADTTEENCSAHARHPADGVVHKFGTLVLTTGNKSEMATGYATLYGDMAGGFAVLKDGRRPASTGCRTTAIDCPGHPQRIIDRPPSAELRPDQTRPGQPATLRGARCDSSRPMSSAICRRATSSHRDMKLPRLKK